MRGEFETRAIHLQPCEVVIAGDITTATKKVLSHLSVNTYVSLNLVSDIKNLLHGINPHRTRRQTKIPRCSNNPNKILLLHQFRPQLPPPRQNPLLPAPNPTRSRLPNNLHPRLWSPKRLHVKILFAFLVEGIYVVEREYDQ